MAHASRLLHRRELRPLTAPRKLTKALWRDFARGESGDWAEQRLNTGQVGTAQRRPSSNISRFFPRIDRIFFGEAHSPFFGAQDEGFLDMSF